MTADPSDYPCYIAGEPRLTGSKLEVLYPYTGEVTGTVSMAGSPIEQRICAILDPDLPRRRVSARMKSLIGLAAAAALFGIRARFYKVKDYVQ